MRASRLLSATVLLALLAGCVGPASDPEPAPRPARLLHLEELELSAPRFTALPAEEVWLEASHDGERMHMVLWRPDTSADPSWKAPVILVDTPYRTLDAREDPTNSAEPMNLDRYDWLIHELVPRGYAVAYKEVRGTGESGGCLEQTAQAQAQDGYDAIEWLGTQEWSNGKVGMFGKSYLAETQYSAAILQPPHLATIVPVASVSGQYEWNFYDGVSLAYNSLVGTAFYIQGSSVPPGTTPQGLANYPGHFTCQAEMLAAGADVSGDWNAYWEARELRKGFANLTASVLYVHGLQDWNVRQVAVRDSFEHIPTTKRLVLGQWRHDFPEDNVFRAEWSRTDWRAMVHAWYDHELLGIANGILDRLPPVQVQDNLGAWRAEAAYPPADSAPVAFRLAPGTLLAPGEPAEPMALPLREAGPGIPGLAPAGAAGLPDELRFTSAPLAEDLRFSGWPVLRFNLTLASGLPTPDGGTNAHFAADLWIAGCPAARWVNEGFLSARHREGVERPQPVPTGTEVAYSLRFSPADTVVPAGCSLELRLAGSNANGVPAWTLWEGVLSAGELEFPTVSRDLARVGLDAPMAAP